MNQALDAQEMHQQLKLLIKYMTVIVSDDRSAALCEIDDVI